MSLSNELHCHQNALKTKLTILLFEKKKKNLVLAVLDLHCCVGFSLVAVSRGYSLLQRAGFLFALASLVEHRL